MEDRWVTNLSKDRKRFYLVSSLLDPHTKMFSFCDNKYFPSSWKDDALGYLSMDLKSFYVQPTQGEVKDNGRGHDATGSRSDWPSGGGHYCRTGANGDDCNRRPLHAGFWSEPGDSKYNTMSSVSPTRSDHSQR
jgi:hypothetical protein